MSWKEQEEKEQSKSKRYEPSLREVQELALELKKFKQMLINTRLASPFELYLVSLRVVSISATGQLICHDPDGFERLSKTNAKLELREYYEQEATFQQFPAEKTVFLAKLGAMRSKMEI